ncbi:MAG: HD domain-containing protein [Sumerlaeia bacterium]
MNSSHVFNSEKFLRDPIHDLIGFQLSNPTDQLLLSLMDAPEFQRLRRIRQTGFAYLVFPGAEHSRFTHSLGVLHLARRMLNRLDPEQNLTPLKRTATQVAALLHDVGHGPYSHVMEAWFGFRHEIWTQRIIASPETRLNQLLTAFHPELPALVLSAFQGTLEPRWLNQLLDSQLDVDRFDYLLRDSHMTGVKDGIFDLERLLLMMRIHPETQSIYTHSKGLIAVEKYIQSRYHMYRQVYFHKTVATAEAMLLSALRRAQYLWEQNPTASNNKSKQQSFREACPPLLRPYFENPTKLTVQEYIAVDDSILTSALLQWAATSANPILQDLSQRLINRELFKCIEIQNFDSNDLENQLRIDRAKTLLQKHGFDPEYYLQFSHSSDAPYQPYTNTASKKHPILIQTSTGQLEDVQHTSPTIKAYTESPYTLWRVFYPNTNEPDWRHKMRKIFVE